MIRWVMVVAAVVGIGLMEVPGLLARREERRELVAVSLILALSLASGLVIVAMPEGASVAKLLHYFIAPLGEALFGPL